MVLPSPDGTRSTIAANLFTFGRPSRRRASPKPGSESSRPPETREHSSAPSGRLLSDWMEEWLEAAEYGLRENTISSYQGLNRAYIEPALGRVPLARLTPPKIKHELYLPMLKRGLAFGTCHPRAQRAPSSPQLSSTKTACSR